MLFIVIFGLVHEVNDGILLLVKNSIDNIACD